MLAPKFHFYFSIIILLFAGCTSKAKFHILKISGADIAYNGSHSSLFFGSLAEFEDEKNIYITVSEGDLIGFEASESDQVTFLRYKSSFGTSLDLEFDKNNPAFTFINGKLHSIDLRYDSLPPVLPSGLGEKALSDIDLLMIDLPLNDILFSWIETNLPDKSGINLAVEGNDEINQLSKLLNHLNPNWVDMQNLQWKKADEGWKKGMKNTSLLAVSLPLEGDDYFYLDIPSLKTLIIAGKDEGITSDHDFGRLLKLENLIHWGSPVFDFSVLKDNKQLKNLFVMLVDSFISTEILASMIKLEALGLTGSEWQGDLPHLPKLKWTSLPVNFTQSSFTTWCAQHPNIEVLEIIENENISDYKPLENLRHLKSLSSFSDASLESLPNLKELELLTIYHENFHERNNEIMAVTEKMPQVTVVPGKGFCLGSGWILLLLPVFFIIFIFRRKEGKI